mgnify:CR=1 FL=1
MKTALVLSGGGAGGAFQIGVLKKIWEVEQHNISEIYGTSVGALNGAALKYIGLTQLSFIWENIKGRSDILTFNPLCLLGLARGKYKTKPLEKLISLVVDRVALRPRLDVFVSTVDLISGEIFYANSNQFDFKKHVLASACVPFHMEPVGNLVDGGVRDHTPIEQAIKNGATRIIVICCNPIGRRQRDEGYKTKWPYLIDIGLRCTDILQAEVLYGDLMRCFYRFGDGVILEVYAPTQRIIETFEYEPAKIAAAIEQGRNCEVQLIQEIM